jgi:Glycosyl transferase family 2
VSWHPLRHARHIRGRALQALEDTTRTGIATARIEEELSLLRNMLADNARELQRNGRVMELIYEEEMRNIRELWQLRHAPAYTEAFTEQQPLISVIIPTYMQTELLVSRAIPSALGQTYPNIEIVIVGDGAPPETALAIEQLNDPRIRYINLTARAPYPEDPAEFWRVAGTPPWNAAWQSARGHWIAPLNDDDAFRPAHIELLLDAARTRRCEVAYGTIEQHQPDGANKTLSSWPPESHRFGWQAAIIHAGLGFMPMQLGSGALGVPGDWSLCRRMLRAGVSFTKVEEIVVDYFPSLLWDQEQAG